MMIEVEHLTKRYAAHTAVDDLSFQVARGEVVGFLGPNGAGKTTTMRILSCYLPATSGSARVAGFDVFSQSLEVRRRVGYMPENTPLYADLRVDEFLTYRAALRGLDATRARRRLGEVQEMCSLTGVRRRIIGQLSKGYRQRVGLADALLHEPELLILDEPTIGLDPGQIREVRELIGRLGGKHTVLLSSHILPEVEAACSRVIIINRGRIAASGTPAELVRQSRVADSLRVELKAGAAGAAEALRAVAGVREVAGSGAVDGWENFDISMEAGADPREAIYHLAGARQWTLRELSRRTPSLEQVFIDIIHADHR
jgi:ABC-2 type transport system ATP-binding protein